MEFDITIIQGTAQQFINENCGYIILTDLNESDADTIREMFLSKGFTLLIEPR